MLRLVNNRWTKINSLLWIPLKKKKKKDERMEASQDKKNVFTYCNVFSSQMLMNQRRPLVVLFLLKLLNFFLCGANVLKPLDLEIRERRLHSQFLRWYNCTLFLIFSNLMLLQWPPVLSCSLLPLSTDIFAAKYKLWSESCLFYLQPIFFSGFLFLFSLRCCILYWI